MNAKATKPKITSPWGTKERKSIFIPIIERSQIPAHIELALGASLNMHQDGGQVVEVVITDLTETHVTLDANHPLAGKDLTFDLELVSIQ